MSASAVASVSDASTQIGALLRHWRALRHISQLDLALEAGISTRHVSYVETGRAQPSREMIIRLATALQVPLRERNALLLAAGYAPLYRQNGLDAPEMEEAKRAIDFLLAQQEPYPAFVVDRYWNILMMNCGTRRFFSLFPKLVLPERPNAIRLVFQPDGLRPFIANWESLAARLIQRVHREAATVGPSDSQMAALREELLNYPGVPSRWRTPDLASAPPAFLTIDYRWNEYIVRLFSTITTFGTPQDVTLQELRIECFFPADETTRSAFSLPHVPGSAP
ncbi:MAG: helix-turn-helix transcriptional regulator [Acidobacteriaceae bacterium]|nr:helix-turn-helix transcriptional regulator [Acidobacteriaceae bacterium]